MCVSTLFSQVRRQPSLQITPYRLQSSEAEPAKGSGRGTRADSCLRASGRGVEIQERREQRGARV
eukprot:7388573-Prymnesium_polylepis.2